MNHSELNRYMNQGIRDILDNALKASLKNRHEFRFLLRFLCSAVKARRIRMRQERQGLHIPPFLIASISSNCNLRCSGCYARANQSCCEQYSLEMQAELPGKHAALPKMQIELPLSSTEWDRVFCEAGGMGISFILLAGGEPLMRRDVLDKASNHPNIIFPVFTNGTLIDDSWLTFFDEKRNLIPVFSLEGNREETDARRGKGVYDKIISSMSLLKEKAVLFGVSITVTTENISRVTEYEFVHALSELGSGIIFFVEYVPVTEETISIVPTESDRALMERRIQVLRSLPDSQILLSFPGDVKYSGGCLAAGRGFFHISPFGGAEPCPFSPISDRNVKDYPLKEVLSSSLFQKLKESGMLSLPHEGGCALFDREGEIRKMMALEQENSSLFKESVII
jgi:MoaA/NifB/PqqE/SkfB family radical SAM enzyme